MTYRHPKQTVIDPGTFLSPSKKEWRISRAPASESREGLGVVGGSSLADVDAATAASVLGFSGEV
jgi:hypothetical protein